MANTSISNLAAGAAVSATDLVPNVQSIGAGPVKTTAAQLKTFMSASPTLVTPALGTPSSGDFSAGTFTWPTFAVTNGGTGTATAFTAGSVVFAGASGVYSQDNSNLFWNNTNKYLGIGTTAPSALFHVNSSTTTVETRLSIGSTVTTQFIATAADTIITNLGAGAFRIVNVSERMRLDASGNMLLGTTSSPTTGKQCFTIETDTAPTATPADTISIYSTDLSAGNTMLSLYTEGTVVNVNATAAATHRIAIRVNGTVYYLLANTSA